MSEVYRHTKRKRAALYLGFALIAAWPWPTQFTSYIGSAHGTESTRRIADTTGCGTRLLGTISVAVANHTPTIIVSANGIALTLIVDTGSQRTIFTPEAAARIGAQAPKIEFQRQVHGLGGNLKTREIELRSFEANGVSLLWHRVLVAPLTLANVPIPVDGVLGADVVSSFDIELDLARGRMTFFEKQSCASAAPNWRGLYLALDVGRSRAGRLFFPVKLDGHTVVAFIDTGAQRTALSKKSASTLGLSEAVLAADRQVAIRGVTSETLVGNVHRFTQLKIGPVMFPNPDIVVGDISLQDADLILGMDFFSLRRLWLSYGSRRVFLATR